jgi:vancomycin resistance protein YoaR
LPTVNTGKKAGTEEGQRSPARRRIAGWLPASCAVVIGLFAALVAADHYTGAANAGKIYGGVEVGGVPLGGKTPTEARKVLEERTRGGLEEIQLIRPEEEFVFPNEELGVDFDVAATVEEAYAVGRRGNLFERLAERAKATQGTVRVPPAVDYEQGTARAKIEDLAGRLNEEPREASLSVVGEEVRLEESRDGYELDVPATVASVGRAAANLRGRAQMVGEVLEPRLTTEETETLKPTDLIGSYRTNYLTYDDSEGRIANLKIASSAIDGTLLAPGEVFSFNELPAPLEYQETKVIINGEVDTAEGGGLCQVSSTLYMAANYAGLESVERHPHYAELPYIRPGFDATVWFGGDQGQELDMRFKNTTEGYVLLREWVEENTGWVYAEIWGRPTDKEVEMSSKQVSSGPGYTKWVTYQKVTQDGKVIFDGILHKDTYQPLED